MIKFYQFLGSLKGDPWIWRTNMGFWSKLCGLPRFTPPFFQSEPFSPFWMSSSPIFSTNTWFWEDTLGRHFYQPTWTGPWSNASNTVRFSWLWARFSSTGSFIGRSPTTRSQTSSRWLWPVWTSFSRLRSLMITFAKLKRKDAIGLNTTRRWEDLRQIMIVRTHWPRRRRWLSGWTLWREALLPRY